MSAATLLRPVASTDARPGLGTPELAEICAETADWIAADLERRGAAGHVAAAARIRARAARYRAEARRLQED
jgi:hypothetical protein